MKTDKEILEKHRKKDDSLPHWITIKHALNAIKEIKIELRNAVANYIGSEGCSCCENIDDHKEHKEHLAKLLDVEPYEDNSGYDFYKYMTPRNED